MLKLSQKIFHENWLSSFENIDAGDPPPLKPMIIKILFFNDLNVVCY